MARPEVAVEFRHVQPLAQFPQGSFTRGKLVVREATFLDFHELGLPLLEVCAKQCEAAVAVDPKLGAFVFQSCQFARERPDDLMWVFMAGDSQQFFSVFDFVFCTQNHHLPQAMKDDIAIAVFALILALIVYLWAIPTFE